MSCDDRHKTLNNIGGSRTLCQEEGGGSIKVVVTNGSFNKISTLGLKHLINMQRGDPPYM